MLIQNKLQENIKSDIKKIENKLYNALNDQSKGIYNVQKELDRILTENIPNGDFDPHEYKHNLWEEISEQWAKALSEQIIDVLSKELSDIIAKRLTAYIKSATITIPPGQVTTTTFTPNPLPGATTGISPKANIQ